MTKKQLDAYDLIQQKLRQNGCFRVAESGLYSFFGDTKETHSFLDALYSMGKIKLVTSGAWGQYEIYSDGKVHNR